MKCTWRRANLISPSIIFLGAYHFITLELDFVDTCSEISLLQEFKLFLAAVKTLSTRLYDGFTLMPVGLLHNSFWARSYFLSDFFPQCFWVVQDWQPWRLNHSVLPQDRGQVGAATGSCSDRKLLKCKSLIWWVHFLVQPVLLISPD